MPCYKPLKGWVTPTGMDFARKGRSTPPTPVPCGQCIGCRLDHSRDWALRCVLEASLYDDNCFLTLTYDEDHLPGDRSLVKPHFQKFFKRLRKKYEPRKIRYFMCGEYGENLGRPHYHAIIFNYRPDDCELFEPSRSGEDQYTSATIQSLWGKGLCTIGEVNYQTAAYTARYCLKKVTGSAADAHYERVNEYFNFTYQIEPEYAEMSRRPGIGSDWYKQFSTDVFPSDFITIDGEKHRIPRFFTNRLQTSDAEAHAEIKENRKISATKHKSNNTRVRLRVRKKCAELRAKQLVREL
ncbi:replication initiator protein [Microviridae sp.]|nr:replication initiator protein [Microviridae sp.]